MIISHKHRYVYIQLDKTASSMIARELRKNYDGEPILWKHATYEDFMKVATPEEKRYFKFAGIRNALDMMVSIYHLRNEQSKGFKKTHDLDFPAWFRANAMIVRGTYDSKTKDYDKLDFVYRYENLQKDLSRILSAIDVRQKRPFPQGARTPNKRRSFWSYYTPCIHKEAEAIAEDHMRRFGYSFPCGWNNPVLWKLRNVMGIIYSLPAGIAIDIKIYIDEKIGLLGIYLKKYIGLFGIYLKKCNPAIYHMLKSLKGRQR